MNVAQRSRLSAAFVTLSMASLALSACSAAEPDVALNAVPPSRSPTNEFDWQQQQLQDKADELWNAVERQFPDAVRPEAKFVEWSTAPALGGSEQLRDCLNETSSSEFSTEEREVGHYVCFVQYPVEPEDSTEDADTTP
ncbi:hypothetical protein ESZ53_08310 [Salinibacterium sp. UTAS2018]|uniref:hypothetical protein n=1 Tax=Salinibacterium sp. UTAS2018 TaxID=2508880 RepID=UPI00100979E3|nr:hypothetical protein [Salinibacterium sp. UTAS2018]QAV70442.1 hypothetical protein ESZ53_08310 [Salinibacterium sp. UTAS2018]